MRGVRDYEYEMEMAWANHGLAPDLETVFLFPWAASFRDGMSGPVKVALLIEVLAFVAHEIKSPVAGARTALTIVEQGYAGEVPEKMRPSLEKLRRYLDRGLDMAVNFTWPVSRSNSRPICVNGVICRPFSFQPSTAP